MIRPLYSLKWFKTLRTLPIIEQFILMFQAPLPHNRCRLTRQLTTKDIARFNAHLRHKTLILNMHMGRRMIVVPHAHDHAKEDRKNRHQVLLPYCLPTHCL